MEKNACTIKKTPKQQQTNKKKNNQQAPSFLVLSLFPALLNYSWSVINCHDIWLMQDLGHRICSELLNHVLIFNMYTCLLGNRVVHDIYIVLH